MGLLSSITSGIQKAANTAVGKVVVQGLKTFETIVQHPIQSISSIGNKTKFNTLSEKTNAQPLGTQIGNILKTTGGAAAAVVGVGAVAKIPTAVNIVSKVTPVVTAVIPKSTTGKVVAAVAAPVAISAIANNPVGAVKTVAKTVEAQVDLGKTLANPSISSAKEYVSEHPIATAVVGAGTVAAIGGGIGLAANTVATYLNSKATKENTESTMSTDNISTPSTLVPAAPNKETASTPISSGANPTAPNLPITAQTRTVTTGSSGVRKSRRKPQKPSIVSQKVQIQVNNASRTIGVQNKNYLKREVYA